VRGGPESRTTITHAIDLALAHDARLTFFRVMDAEFLTHATIGPLSVVYQELNELALFTMNILCDRASRRGVRQTDAVVRQGNIQRQLQEMAATGDVDLLVMGRPVRSPGSNVFRPAEFDAFVAALKQSREGLRIEVVTPSPGVEQ
jgi:nucleotide-binding universal stress UspA family protein